MRVVIADDESLLREGMTLLLASHDIDVVAAVGDVESLHTAVREHEPDLVITDIRMPPGMRDDGLQAALALRAQRPELAVLVLSQHVERRYALELLAAGRGGLGYLLKQRVSDGRQFCADLRQLVVGGTVLDPEVVDAMLERGPAAGSALQTLTQRQRQVLALVAEGRSNAAIAAQLSISEKAVVGHVSNIYDALDLRRAATITGACSPCSSSRGLTAARGRRSCGL